MRVGSGTREIPAEAIGPIIPGKRFTHHSTQRLTLPNMNLILALSPFWICMVSRTRASVRLGMAVFAAVLVQSLIGSSAQAGCGDYVRIGGRAPAAIEAADPADREMTSPDGMPAPHRSSECHGPFCSRPSQHSQSPEPRVVVPTLEQFGCLNSARMSGLVDLFWVQQDATARPLSGFPLRFEPPPRLIGGSSFV